jgi:hypothetical protein
VQLCSWVTATVTCHMSHAVLMVAHRVKPSAFIAIMLIAVRNQSVCIHSWSRNRMAWFHLRQGKLKSLVHSCSNADHRAFGLSHGHDTVHGTLGVHRTVRCCATYEGVASRSADSAGLSAAFLFSASRWHSQIMTIHLPCVKLGTVCRTFLLRIQ